MFRKIVSNLPFSPALVGQLGFYAKRLRKEEATRRIGLIFTALALVVQFFAVFQPPEAANAASGNDLVSGGVSSVTDFLHSYDTNTNNIRDLFTAVGISRADITRATTTTVNNADIYSWGQQPKFSAAQGEHPYTIRTASGGTKTFYYRPQRLWDGRVQSFSMLTGRTASGMWFGIMFQCGNLVLKQMPPVPPCPTGQIGTYPNCRVPQCPAGTIGTYPNCKTPPAPTATCTNLAIAPLVNNRYQLTGSASVANGATISAYTYTVKKDGKVVVSTTNKSTAATNTATLTETKPGTYQVTLTVQTSVGAKTSSECAHAFTIAPPQMCAVNPKLPKNSPDCQPCPGDLTIWIKDAKCSATITQTKTSTNMTQGGVDATTVAAKASDVIQFTLTMKNSGKAPTTVTPQDQIDGITDYATVDNLGGATYDATTKKLTWPQTTVAAGQSQVRTFTIKMLRTIPSMGQGASDPTSYNCKMYNTFGNNITINVECPPQKVVENTVEQLPHTGAGENMLFAGAVFAIVAYFYARSRQMNKEVRLIRRDLNAGAF